MRFCWNQTMMCNMLQAGPYPYYLKRRILGDHGHLSNENAGRLLCYILHDKLKQILLGHLSKENNYEELAYETVKLEIDRWRSPIYRRPGFFDRSGGNETGCQRDYLLYKTRREKENSHEAKPLLQ